MQAGHVTDAIGTAAQGVNDSRRNTKSHVVLSLLMTSALAGFCLAPQAFAQSAKTARQAGQISLDIPAQTLSRSLIDFSRASGVQLFFDANLVRSKNAPAVRGNLSTTDALGRILAGSGLTYSVNGNTVTISGATAVTGGVAADGSTTLSTITVEGTGSGAIQADGLASAGYRPETISSLGPLGQTSIRDTPYSVAVVPRELIQNIQAQSPDDIFRISPTVRTVTPQASGWSPMINMRGFKTYDTAEDGLRRPYSHATVIEDKERIEVLTGLSGFLYGAASPAGMANYVYKRPTTERLNSITTGTYGGAQKYVHGDFGGRFGTDDNMGYRLNIVKQNGETSIDDQNINRFLVSGAFDWDITEQLKLELNASYSKYRTENSNSYWFFPAGVPHGEAPDASKNWGQQWIQDEFVKKRFSGKLTYELNDFITLRGGYMRENGERPRQDHTMNSVRSPGQYHQIAIHSGATKGIYDAAQVFADFKFDTGSVSHTLTAGYHMYQDRDWQTPYSPNTGWIGPFPMTSPLYLPKPVFPADTSSPYYTGYVRNHNFMIGDRIEFSEAWSALAGVNYSRIMTRSLDSTGAKSDPDYDQGRLSPSVSLMYKPASGVTLYASYIEGLEQGGVAPETAINSGQVMAPMVSRQKEIGVKAEWGDVLLTGALFDIDKAYELTNTAGVYAQDGRQRHRGVEVTATGKLTDALTILGGVTLLDTDVEGGTYDGKTPMNVANVLAKLYAEYEIPGVEGFVLTGGVYYTGKQWANDANNDRLPAVTTADLGMRYTTERFGNPLTLRFNVSNITNENYWLNSYYLGAPRTFAFSAQMKF